MVTYVALLLQQLQAGVVCVKLEGLVEEVWEHWNSVLIAWTTASTSGLQQVWGVRALRLRQLAALRDSRLQGGTHQRHPARTSCSKMADTASSDASVSRRVGRAGSHTWSTGAAAPM
jgi:hypothetical protein